MPVGLSPELIDLTMTDLMYNTIQMHISGRFLVLTLLRF